MRAPPLPVRTTTDAILRLARGLRAKGCRDLAPSAAHLPLIDRFRRASSGVASVEFALLATLLMILFAGFLDLSYMVRARQFSDRASMLMARAFTACATAANNACNPTTTLMKIYAARANILVRYPDAVVGMVAITNKNGSIKVCYGPTTYLESDVMASAQSILKPDDQGVAVFVKTTHTTFFPNYAAAWLSGGSAIYRDYTVDVSTHDRPCV